MKNKPQIRNRFSHMRRTVVMAEHDDSVATQQQFKDECDMNRIVKNAQRGIPPKWVARGQPHYGDFSNVPDLMQAHDLIQNAKQAFLDLPSGLRAELRNDYRNIGELTDEQVERYKLGKILPKEQDPEGNPPGASSEPAKAASRAPKGAPKGTPAATEAAED